MVDLSWQSSKVVKGWLAMRSCGGKLTILSSNKYKEATFLHPPHGERLQGCPFKSCSCNLTIFRHLREYRRRLESTARKMGKLIDEERKGICRKHNCCMISHSPPFFCFASLIQVHVSHFDRIFGNT